jgi:hypothetical protein
MQAAQATQAVANEHKGHDTNMLKVMPLKNKSYNKNGSTGEYGSLPIQYNDASFRSRLFGLRCPRGAVESKFQKGKYGLTFELDPSIPHENAQIVYLENASKKIQADVIQGKMIKGVNPSNIESKVPGLLLYTFDDEGKRVSDATVKLYATLDVRGNSEAVMIGKRASEETDLMGLSFVADVDLDVSHIYSGTNNSIIKYIKGLQVRPTGLSEESNRVKRGADAIDDEEQALYDAILSKRAKMAETAKAEETTDAPADTAHTD